MGFFDGCEDCCSPRAYVWRTARFLYAPYYIPEKLPLGYGSQCSNPYDRPPLLGTGRTTIPKQSDWIFLATSKSRSYGILADGSLWGWGEAPLGDGTLNDRYHPHRIGSERWKYVSTCDTHTLAIKQDGTLWAWGQNENGQLGNGNAYPSITEGPRVMLNSSIAAVYVIEDMIQYVRNTPTSVSFVKGGTTDPGSGATATCTVSLSVAGIAYQANANPNYSSGNIHYAVNGGSGYKSVPKVVVTPSVSSDSPEPCIITANCRFTVYGATIQSGGSGYGPDTAVVFSKNADGNYATATCTVVDGVITSISPQYGAYYETPPTVTFTGGGAGAKASPTILNGYVTTLTIASGGSGYTAPPTITFEGGEPTVPASTFAAMQGVSVDLKLTGGGSGYTQTDRGIRVRLNFASGSPVDIGYVDLSPGGLSHIAPFESFTSITPQTGVINFEPFVVTHDLMEITSTQRNANQMPYPDRNSAAFRATLSGLNVTASIVSSEGADIPLNVTFDAESGGWKVSMSSPLYGRTKQFVVRVSIPAFDYSYTPPNIETITSSHAKGPIGQSFVVEKGDAQLYNPTGAWEIADKFDNTTLFRATSTTQIGFQEWVETQSSPFSTSTTWSELSDVTYDNVRGGEPIFPRLQYIPWGWTKNSAFTGNIGYGTAYGFGYYYYNNYAASSGEYTSNGYVVTRNPPEWASTVYHVKERCYNVFVDRVNPATSFPSVATIIEGDGSGGVISGSFSSSNGKMILSVSQSGSGYTTEPKLTATTLAISPQRIGSESDWQSVVAIEGSPSFSAGLRQDGWPMRWGGYSGPNYYYPFLWAQGLPSLTYVSSFTPEKIGFPLFAKLKDPKTVLNWMSWDQRFGSDRIQYFLPPSSAVVGGLAPHTNGRLFANRFAGGSSITAQSPQGSLCFTDTALQGSVRSWNALAGGIAGDLIPSWSRYCGAPEGLYSFADIQSLADAPTPKDTGSTISTYQHFVPFPYSRDKFIPELLPVTHNGGYAPGYTFIGSCFTSAPHLGPEVDCSLHAPGACTRLFVDGGALMGVSQSGEVWKLQPVGSSDASYSNVHIFPQADESATIDIKGYKYEADVIWEWATAEREMTVVLLSSNFGYGDFSYTRRSDTFKAKYLLPPTKKVKNESSGWDNSIAVSPYRSWKIVITNPGSGYKPTDSIRIRIYGGKTFSFSRTKTQTSAAEKDTIKTGTLTYTYEGRVVGDSSLAGRKLNAKTRVSAGGWNNYATMDGQTLPDTFSWGHAGAYSGKPPRRISVPATTGANWETLECDKQDIDINVIKKLTCHLVDSYEPKLADVPEVNRNNVGGYGFMTGLIVSGGGLYLDPISHNNDVIESPSNLFVTVPSVEIIADSGSGSGATAKLVPAKPLTGTGNALGDFFTSDIPVKVSNDVNAYDKSITSANAQYGVTSGGLVQFNNPAVNAPPSHQIGISSFANHTVKTSSRDLMRLRSSSSLEVPRAFPNVELTLDDAGKNYRLPPLITMPQPHSDVAVADAHIDGKLVSLGVENAGSGYRFAPTLTLIGGEGSGASARAVISGPVDSVTLTSGGSGYAASPQVVFSDGGIPATATATARGYVSSVVIADGGSGYTASPPFVLFSGDGSGAEATATTSGRVNIVYASSGGGGYDGPPTVTISGGGGSGATAVARMALNQATGKYSISYFEVTNAGDGYTSRPTVTIPPPPENNPGAFQAIAIAEIDFYVSSVAITSGGQGYSTPPGITIVGGNARAFAFLSMSVTELSLGSGGTYRTSPSISFRPVATVESISLTSAGSNYTRAPEVFIVGGGGSGAAAVCTIGTDGKIKKLTLTARGSGYRPDSTPRVVFVGGGGDGASATATVQSIGSGGSGTATINGSLLFAEPTADGSGYQFAPNVTISGGGNQKLAALNADLSSGRVTQTEYDAQVDDIRGVVVARIEGAIDRIDITNSGSKYTPVPDAFDSRNGALIFSRADVRGFVGKNGDSFTYVFFNAESDWPGSGVSQPSSLPATPFLQKPQIRFQNGIYVEVQDFYISRTTCRGLRTYPSKPSVGGVGGVYFSSLDVSSVANGPLSFYEFNLPWSYGNGLSQFSFDKAPSFDVIDSAGRGASVTASLDGSGKVAGLSFSSQGSGYTSKVTVKARDGWLKVVECQASCTVDASGAISSVTISNPGSGYVAPVAIVHGGGGSGCLLSVDLVDGTLPRSVRSIAVTGGGGGYSQTSPPSVLVYESAGSFSDGIYGQNFNEIMPTLVVSPFRAESYSGEFALPYSTSTPEMSPLVSGEYVVDSFQRHQSIENLKMELAEEEYFLHSHQSTPSVTVSGTADRQASVSATIAKWTGVVDSTFYMDSYAFNRPHEFTIALRDTGP